jgi:CheY-like chemotaxis protein
MPYRRIKRKERLISMSKRILVIEDEKDLRNLLQDELVAHGYKVFTASNGQEGLDMLLETEPDLIICDRAMPIMSGFQLLERIKGAFPQYVSIPFIFLTALSDPRDRHSVSHLEPYAYLGKPVDFDLLHSTIQKALS